MPPASRTTSRANVLSLETNLFDLVGAALQAKGHEVRAVTGGAVGGYQGILFTRDPTLPAPTFDRGASTEDSAGERSLPRGFRPPQGRTGGRLVRALPFALLNLGSRFVFSSVREF